MQKQDIIKNLETGFNLSSDESAVAFALLEQRSQSLHFDSVNDYVDAFYPKGFVVKDADPAKAEHGFVEYLDSDARSLIHTSSRADFPAFLRASAISFRHQMPEDLKQQAETAFGVKDGKWTGEQTKMFALAFEEYVKYRFDPDGIKNIYKRAEKFTENMHNQLSVLGIEADKMIDFYDSFFTDEKWHFDEAEYYKQIQALQLNSLKKSSHQFIFLGMTAPIYQAAGFDRLPCFIDGASLQQVIDPWNFWYNIKHPDNIFKMPHDNTIYIEITHRDDNDNPVATGIYTMRTDGERNIITKVIDSDRLMEIDRALQTNEVLQFNPLEDNVPLFFQNPYSLQKDTPAFYKNDQLEMPLFNLDKEQDTSGAAPAAGKTKGNQTTTAKIKIVNNKELERVQLFFDDIPPEEQRAELKAHGWHWSPRQHAWQRKNTENALANANEFAAKFYPEMQKATATMQAETSAVQQNTSESTAELKPTEADREHFHVVAGSDLQKAVYDLVNKDYWIVEFNEISPFNQGKFDGTIVTEELLRELQKLDQDQYEYNNEFGFNEDGSVNDRYVGYSKFYFDHVVNGETVEHFHIDIGDGTDATCADFEHIYKAIGATPEIVQEQSNDNPAQKVQEPHITTDIPELIKFDEFLSETAAARIKNIPELKGVIKEIEAKPLYQNDALFKFVKGGDFVITLARNYAEYKGLKVFDTTQEQEKLIALLQKNNIDVESYAEC